MIYLAIPYNDPDHTVREFRYKAVNKVAGKLMLEGHHVYSPISHSHSIAKTYNLPRGWEYWSEHDKKILKICKKLIVLKLPGWDKSLGVTAEIKFAQENNIPIEYMEYVESTTEPFNTNDHLNDFETIINSLFHSRKFGMECEVIWSALNAMKNNPTLSITEALEFGVRKWKK